MQEDKYFVYINSNTRNTVLYTGMTNNLPKRTLEHKENRGSYFTKKYNVHKLVYFEEYSHPDEAISREKQIKNYSRAKKIELITKFNPEWKDLYNDDICLW